MCQQWEHHFSCQIFVRWFLIYRVLAPRTWEHPPVFINSKPQVNEIKICLHTPLGDCRYRYVTKSSIYVPLPLLFLKLVQMLWNAALDQEAIRTGASVMYPMTPPIMHPAAGHELFDKRAKLHIWYIQATFDCNAIYCLYCGRNQDAFYQWPSFKCFLPNLLQPIA